MITGFQADEVVGTYCFNNILNHVDGEGNQLCFDGCPLQATLLDQQDRSARVYLHHKKGHRVGVQVKTIAFTDALCEIPNRRYGEMQLKKFRLEQEEGEAPYALAIVDIDHFKQVNDTHGHDIGDEILKMTAKTLAGSIRSADTAVRWGGEEFLLILPGLDEEHLYPVLEKLRMLVENSRYRNGELEAGVTVSIGGAAASPEISNEELFKIADTNLYRAKNGGRNQVVV